MGFPNSLPLRPYLTIRPIDLNGAPVGDSNVEKDLLFDIPYNFIQNFEINFTNGVGKVDLQIFDPTFTLVLDSLVKMVSANGISPSFNFVVNFGYGPENASKGMIFGQNNPTYENYRKTFIKETGEYHFERNVVIAKVAPDRMNLQSQDYKVFFDEIQYELYEAGVEYHFKGYNSDYNGLKYYTQVEKAYSGTPIELITKITKDVFVGQDVQIIGLDSKKDGVRDGDKKFAYNPGNRMLAKIYEELLEDVDYGDGGVEWSWFLDTSEDRKVKVHFVKNNVGLENREFLGRYQYYIGNHSNVVRGLKMHINNLLPFFSEQEVGFIDSKTKQNYTQQSNTFNKNNNIATNPNNNGFLNGTDKMKKIVAGMRSADVVPPPPIKGRNENTLKSAQKKATIRRNSIIWPFEIDMITLGDPVLSYRHLFKSFIQLDVFQSNGDRNELFSGVYLVQTFSHTIGVDGMFFTHIKLIKQNIVTNDIEFKKNIEVEGLNNGGR